MYGDLDEFVLSGKLFNGGSPSSSPARSRSHSPEHWPNTNSDYDVSTVVQHDSENDVLDELEDSAATKVPRSAPRESIGMKPGRTGVKGVIRDRDEMRQIQSERKAREIKELNEKMERTNLGGLTYLEEKALEEKEALKREDMQERQRLRQELRTGQFGHLREVGMSNFVSAIEKEDAGVWVIVHIYDPSLERCAYMDFALAKLARSYPSVKFIRTKASAVGFASTRSKTNGSYRTSAGVDSDDDIQEEEGAEDEEFDVDTDVLPTVLAYRDGDLIHNWVRVDWVIEEQIESGTGDIEALLQKHRIIPSTSNPVIRGFSSDDDDSLEIEFEHDDSEY